MKGQKVDVMKFPGVYRLTDYPLLTSLLGKYMLFCPGSVTSVFAPLSSSYSFPVLTYIYNDLCGEISLIEQRQNDINKTTQEKLVHSY